jgi:hypothetical protein
MQESQKVVIFQLIGKPADGSSGMQALEIYAKVGFLENKELSAGVKASGWGYVGGRMGWGWGISAA